MSIKRPLFIQVWRKGYDDEGTWTPSLLAYTRHKKRVELLHELYAAGDLNKMNVDELRILLKRCSVVPPLKKEMMIQRLREAIHVVTKKTGQS